MKNLVYILIILVFTGCKTETLEVIIESDYSGEAYLFNTETQKTDTIETSGNGFIASLKEIGKPTLFYLTFKGINLNRPIYLMLSKQETQIKFDKLIAVNENSLNFKDRYPNRPSFLSDPNKNEAFYQFQDFLIEFNNHIMKPELDYEARKELYDNFISNSEIIIKENKSFIASAFIIEYLMNNKLIQLDKIQLFYSYLEPDIQTSSIGQKIKKEVGLNNMTIAPKFSIQDYQGNNYTLDSLTGKKVLLHFWSSSCAPCIKEIPELLKLSDDNKDLIVINISLDTDKSRWISGMERVGISNMINYCDFKGANGEICKKYQVRSIPANYLIDEKGNIVSKKETLLGLKGKL